MLIPIDDLSFKFVRITIIVFAIILLFTGYFKVGPWLSGWSKLAKIYPFKGTLPQKKRSGFFVNLGKQTAPEPATALSVDEQGVYMWKYFPFAITYPPIFVPWSDITLMRPITTITKPARIKIVFDNVPEIFVTISGMPSAEIFVEDLIKNSPKAVVQIGAKLNAPTDQAG